MPQIGVVTVLYNSECVLDDFMEALSLQMWREFTLFAVDNHSSDGSRQKIRRHWPFPVVLIENDKNVGVAEGNNQGIRAALSAGCDQILLLNNDTTFPPELLGQLVIELERSGCDMIAPKMMYHEPNNRIWYAGGTFNRWQAYAADHVGLDATDLGQHDRQGKVDYAPTCCLLVKKSVFEQIGLMDQKYFVYYDDLDFCFRAYKAGLGLWYTPTTVLYHKVSYLTGGGESSFSIRYSTRNKVYFIRKYYARHSRLFWLGVYQCLFLARRLAGKDSQEVYKLKRNAFREGLQV